MKGKQWTVALSVVMLVVLLAFSLRGPRIAQAAVNDYPPQEEYALISGIDGGSLVHKGAFDVQNLNFSVTKAVAIGSSSSGISGQGITQLGRIEFTKEVDATTPQLLSLESFGSTITGDIYFARSSSSGGPSVVYYDLHFTGLIASDQQSDALEVVSIQPIMVSLTYRPINLNGSVVNPVTWSYNQVTQRSSN